MIEAETFAAAVARRAASVLSRSDARSERVAIGDRTIQLIGAGAALDRLGRAFLKAPAATVPAENVHRLSVWDGVSPDALPPEPPWKSTDYSPLGVVEHLSTQAARFALDVETNSFIAQDAGRNTSHVWFPSIAALPVWATAAPFRVAMSWLCNLRGVQIVHGASVALEGKAVLLAGKGGSGKSTTALACAMAGLGYLGDDYCAVEPAAGRVHLIYRTAKATRTTLDMLPAIEDWIVNRNELETDKGVLFLDGQEVDLVRSAPLSAILLPRVGPDRKTTMTPATRAEATRAILPNTVMQLMGGTSQTPRLIMQLVQSLPAFHLVLGTDLDGVTGTIASHLLQVPA
jgi:hypothetical protein